MFNDEMEDEYEQDYIFTGTWRCNPGACSMPAMNGVYFVLLVRPRCHRPAGCFSRYRTLSCVKLIDHY